MQARWTADDLPAFDETDRSGLADFYDAYVAEQDAIREALLPIIATMPALNALVQKLTPEQMAEQTARSLALMKGALIDGDWKSLLDEQRRQGGAYATLDVPFREWFDLVGGFKQIVIVALQKRFHDDEARLRQSLLAMARYVDVTMSVIGETYLSTKQKRIDQQAIAIAELSTPVLQLRSQLLLLPIIGVLDTHRARQLTENLLKAIRAHRARVVVMDITGVAAVDSRVANHLLQAVEAARLMGAKVIVSGVAPDVASTIVTLGVDLSRIDTVGDLQSALEAAERIIALKRTTEEPHAPDTALLPTDRAE